MLSPTSLGLRLRGCLRPTAISPLWLPHSADKGDFSLRFLNFLASLGNPKLPCPQISIWIFHQSPSSRVCLEGGHRAGLRELSSRPAPSSDFIAQLSYLSQWNCNLIFSCTSSNVYSYHKLYVLHRLSLLKLKNPTFKIKTFGEHDYRLLCIS